MRIVILTTLFLLVSLPSGAADDDRLRQAGELVRNLRLDELTLLQFRSAFLGRDHKTPLTPAARRCYESLTVADFNRMLAPMFARDFTAEELGNANQFWSSPVGAKFLQMAYLKAWEMDPVGFPLHVAGPKQSVNFAEISAIARFRESVDPRLMKPMEYVTSGAAHADMMVSGLELRMRCEATR